MFKQKSLNKKGFGHVEMIVFAVVVLAVGSIGYFALNSSSARKSVPGQDRPIGKGPDGPGQPAIPAVPVCHIGTVSYFDYYDDSNYQRPTNQVHVSWKRNGWEKRADWSVQRSNKYGNFTYNTLPYVASDAVDLVERDAYMYVDSISFGATITPITTHFDNYKLRWHAIVECTSKGLSGVKGIDYDSWTKDTVQTLPQ